MSVKVRVIALVTVALLVLVWNARGSAETTASNDPESIDFSDVQITDTGRLREILGDGSVDESVIRLDIEANGLRVLREQSYGRAGLESVGRERLSAMSDAEFTAYTNDLVAQVHEYRAQNDDSARRLLDTYRASWQPQPCPAGGSLDKAVFDDLLAEAIGLTSFDDVPGFTPTHVADLSLPDGVVHVSRSSFDDAWSVDLGAPGVHPLFAATVIFEGHESPGFAQIVVGSGKPVRWVEEDRFFLDAEYGSLWISGADAHVLETFDHSDVIESTANWMHVEDLNAQQQPGCEHWAHPDGRNRVRQDASFDGSFPAYVAYDAADNLVAITWDFREFMVPEDTSPGTAQPTPTPVAANNSGPAIETDL